MYVLDLLYIEYMPVKRMTTHARKTSKSTYQPASPARVQCEPRLGIIVSDIALPFRVPLDADGDMQPKSSLQGWFYGLVGFHNCAEDYHTIGETSSCICQQVCMRFNSVSWSQRLVTIRRSSRGMLSRRDCEIIGCAVNALSPQLVLVVLPRADSPF